MFMEVAKPNANIPTSNIPQQTVLMRLTLDPFWDFTNMVLHRKYTEKRYLKLAPEEGDRR